MSGIAEVLAAHEWSQTYFTRDKPYECICGERVDDIPRHQAELLAAAGFGPVKEAAAKALEDAADSIEPHIVRFFEGPEDLNSPRREYLRARAAAVRGDS